jgi:AraC-like DNA-binding protein
MATDLMTLPAFLGDSLADFGLDCRTVLRKAGLEATLFDGGHVRLDTHDFFALFSALEALAAPADMGLRLGTSGPPPGQFDVATLAALHSATFGDALEKLSRYKRLTCPEILVIERDQGELRLEFRWLSTEQIVPALLSDGAFASTVMLYVRGTGKRIIPRRLEYRRRPQNAPMLRRHFGCDILFDAAADLLVFDAEVFDVPFRTHNAQFLELLVPGLEGALTHKTGDSALAIRARDAISRYMRGLRPSVENVAKELCVSSRTLQRRLGEAGTSYQRLVDEVRQNTARKLLAGTNLETAEIAFLLGFEEINSFTRAFQGWEGATPTRWRAARSSH